jgi:membrane protein YdbS with pleckstrin-like domain
MSLKIDEEYKKVLRLRLTLISLSPFALVLIMFIVGFSVAFVFDGSNYPWIPMEVYILLGMLIICAIMCLAAASIWTRKWFENFTYDLDEKGVVINSGVITKSRKFIPYNKIQNLEIISGFIERHYGLSTIRIQTASAMVLYRNTYSREFDGVLPGLRNPEPIADEIRTRMEKVS